MFQVINTFIKTRPLAQRIFNRTFLSPAYYCNEVWNHRLNNPILNKINLEELYQELEYRYHKSGLISAVDVDVFVNSAKEDNYAEELLDLIHKLRLSADTSNTLNSTSHAVIRYLLECDKRDELLNVLDDRLNYGLFLDYYTANILMDKFYKSKDFAAGVRIGSQLMLQEETEHKITSSLVLLHCYNYLLDPKGWVQPVPEPEPEDEVKIRVKYLRNPYDDEHFDLRNPVMIVGKTLVEFTKKNLADSMDKSLHILGLSLYGKHDQAIAILKENKGKLHQNVIELIPDDNPVKTEAQKVQLEMSDVKQLLETRVVNAENEVAEKDVALQCNLYSKWEEERRVAIERQRERLLKATRIENMEAVQKELKSKEEKLWFFEKEEKIELDIEAKTIYYPKKWFGKKKKPKKIDEGYVPPEV